MPDSAIILTNICYYQRMLDRHSKSGNEAKILQCIVKLFDMPVTVSHLEETGIGRTVNSLRKVQGPVGDAARTLVAKWKDMVSERDECEKPENNTSESDSGHQLQNSKKDIENSSSHRNSDRHRNSERKEKHSRNDDHRTDRKHKYDEYKHESIAESNHSSISGRKNDSEDSNSSESNNDEDPESGVTSESDQLSSSGDERVDSEIHSSNHLYEKDNKYGHRSTKGSKESSTEKNSKYKHDSGRDRKRERSDSKERSRRHESYSERDHKKGKSQDSSSSDSNEQSSKRSSSAKRKRDDSESDEESKKTISKKLSHDSHRSSGRSHKSKDQSSSSYKKENKSELDHHTPSRDAHKSSSNRNTESSSRDHRKEKSSSSSRKESKKSSETDSKSSKEDRSKSDDKSKSDKKSSSKDKLKNKQSSKSTSGNGSSSKKRVDIGSESGTSFAEALGMLEPATSHKSNKKLKHSESYSKVEKVEKIVKESKEKVAVEKPTKSDKIDIVIPPPPPKVDLDINIASLLPTITPNYRPVANPFIDSHNTRNKVMNEDEALILVMSQKNQRTKVYSGNKCFFGTVPTLHELCLRILQDNIDALEYTGGVPYSILKPVLDKATPDQLFMLEHHNPYLIEDTDGMWQFHCQKEFRNKKRNEMESWREMYMRCLDEREAKLRALTENIKVAQEKSTPVRQTKLAYVDSVVKPPRDVLRKQAKSGIDKKPVVTPTARLNSIAAAGAVGQVSVPSPVKASSSSGGSSAALKPKKAPLMQKTLAFLKGNRFRR